MHSRLLFVPEFTTETEVHDALLRASFHLGHIDIESLTLMVEPSLRGGAESIVANGPEPGRLFDPIISQRSDWLGETAQVIDAPPHPRDVTRGADVILRWDTDHAQSGRTRSVGANEGWSRSMSIHVAIAWRHRSMRSSPQD